MLVDLGVQTPFPLWPDQTPAGCVLDNLILHSIQNSYIHIDSPFQDNTRRDTLCLDMDDDDDDDDDGGGGGGGGCSLVPRPGNAARLRGSRGGSRGGSQRGATIRAEHTTRGLGRRIDRRGRW